VREIMKRRQEGETGQSIAQGDSGVVVAGCEAFKKKPLGTNAQYLRHHADDVMPVILRTAFKIAAET